MNSTLSQVHPAPLLTVSGLNAWYGAAHILHDVDLQVGRGEVVALMGRNGAGKSTTLKAIMGLLPTRRAEVAFMGHALHKRQAYEIARLGLGYVPEDRRIFTDLTVMENLSTGRQPDRTWPDGSPGLNWTLEAVFDLFPNLAGMRKRLAGAMSGGEQQMLTVARTLMGNPDCLLLDERSEEHTSELQSLMRISYAVFCLKKKIKKTTLHASQHYLFITPLTVELISIDVISVTHFSNQI